MKIKIFFIGLFFTSFLGHSQEKNINQYKYIIVPSAFTFVKKKDQYQTSSLTKFLFNKKGFVALLSDEKFPDDLSKNRCLALTANVKDISGMLTTKNQIELLDCNNNVIFISKIGRSKLKDYKRAYHEAIRNAFTSIKSLKYVYQPKISTRKKVVIPTKPIVVPKKEIKPRVSLENSNKVKVLYAQPIKNGFQFVNAQPKIVFQVLKTSKKNIFILKNKKGILYKNANFWIVEYYQNNQLLQEKFQIKF